MNETGLSDTSLLWRAGRIRYKLHPGQLELYEKYRAWEAETYAARLRGDVVHPDADWPRIYVANCARRFGKDFLGLLIRIEDAIREPKQILTYATALQKDIASIVMPLMEQICDDCPPSIQPYYRQSYQGVESGFYFHNGSVLRLIGLDSNPDGLRGRWSNGVTISEACYVDKLKYVVQSIIMPQFQGHLKATLMMNSTPARDPGHPYKTEFVPDAIKRDAYSKYTIFDNPRLGKAERDEQIRSLGGIEAEECRRECLCEDVRSESLTVLPEFSIAQHVMEQKLPPYACGYTVVDPGTRDLCAIICAYYDFARAKMVVSHDWAQRGAPTNTVAHAIRTTESQAFKDLTFWSDKMFKRNPVYRYSDIDARMILDLNVQHKIKIGAADKDGAEAALNQLRNAFQNQRIEINPRCRQTIQQCEQLIWNKSRTSYERSDALGHGDLVDCLKYAWRHINRQQSPMPPYGIVLSRDIPLENIFLHEGDLRSQSRVSKAANAIMPRGVQTRGRRSNV